MGWLVSLLGVICEVHIAQMFFKKFGYKRISNKVYAVVFLLYVALQFANAIIFNGSTLLFAFAIISTFVFSFSFDIKLPIKFIISVVYSIVMALSEFIIAMLITFNSGIQVEQIQNDILIHFIVILLSKFLSYVILKLIKNKNLFTEGAFNFKFLLCTFMLPVSSIFIIVLLYIYAFRIEANVFKITTFIASILLMISNILIFYIMEKQQDYILTKNRLAFAENHIKTQVKHYNELYEQQESLKKFKHDSKNLYTALLAKLKTMPVEEAVTEIEDKMSIIYRDGANVNSGNPIMDAVINSKIHTASKSDTEIKALVKINAEINVDELELAVLIGNSIDNAIEAVQLLKDSSQKIIKCNLIVVDGMISYNVTNHVIEDVDVKNMTTTKRDKSNHGYGINSIRNIVKKYNGVLDIKCQDKLFTVSAMFDNISK